MKTERFHAWYALAIASVSVASVGLAGCHPPKNKSDWRHPPGPIPCASDADCKGATCMMELGASSGTCGAGDGTALAPGAHPDGGARPGAPGAPRVDIKPSPNDIQL